MELIRTRLDGVAFRITSPRYRDLRATSAMSRQFPGRFNTSDVGAVYASREPTTAVEELRRRSARDGISLSDMHPRAMLVLGLTLHAIVDLTVADQLESWGLTPDELSSDEMVRCQEVATVASRLGAEAIQWPSATGTGQSFSLFVDQLQPGSHVDIAEVFDLSNDDLRALELGTPLLRIMPGISRYPLIA